jgi:glycosyltransferase involved in cell wall biosynthesis
MKISVIINYYNSEIFLRQAISSVLNQTFRNFELILYDNYSTDRSNLIVQSFNDNRIKYFRSNKHVNLSRARKFALNKCENEWVAFLDSDDYWETEKLSIQISKISSSSNIGLIYTDYFIDEESKIKKSPFPSEQTNFEKLLYKNPIVFSSVLFSKSAILNNGGFDPLLKYAEDYDLLLKIAQKKELFFINQKLTYYRIHPANISRKYELRAFAEERYILEKYRNYKNFELVDKYFKRKIKIFFFKLFIKFFAQMQFRKMYLLLKKRLILKS